MTEPLIGASPWERDLFEHVTAHLDHERGLIDEYRRFAEDASAPALRYLATAILDDEVRHHEMFRDLAATIRASSVLDPDQPIPPLSGMKADRDPALATTERFLALEEDDRRELRRLRRELKDVRDTTLWALVVELMEQDTEKHIRILRFIRDALRS